MSLQADKPSFDPMQVRGDFPMLQCTMHGHPLIYLDSAATAYKPQVVIDAISGFYSHGYGTVLRGVYQLAEQANDAYQAARDKVRSFLGAASTEEIIFCRSTTDAINMAAQSFAKAHIAAGDVILLSEMEHHSNLLPWQFIAAERGAQLHFIPINEQGELCLESYYRLLEQLKPKIVAVTHVSNVLGTVNPIHTLAKAAHVAGAVILVDGAQAIPHFPVDVQALDVDFYAFSGHKLYGPTGIGILYGRAALLNSMPPYQGGGSMVDKVTYTTATYLPLPWKFEAGTMMLAEVIGLGAAIDYVEKHNLAAIGEYEQKLLKYALQRLSKVKNCTVYGQPAHRESVISFNIQGIHPLDLGTWLDLKGVAIRTGHHCAQPLLQRLAVKATARMSIGMYSTYADVDAFIDAVEQATVALS
jgi:cysteine desulfurase/selenocysteine lyase